MVRTEQFWGLAELQDLRFNILVPYDTRFPQSQLRKELARGSRRDFFTTDWRGLLTAADSIANVDVRTAR